MHRHVIYGLWTWVLGLGIGSRAIAEVGREPGLGTRNRHWGQGRGGVHVEVMREIPTSFLGSLEACCIY